MIFPALIDAPAAWVGESDNDLMIHAVFFINNNHNLHNHDSMIFQHSTFFHSANGKYPGIDKLPHNQVPGSVTGHIGLDRGPPDRAREDGYQEVVATLDHTI